MPNQNQQIRDFITNLFDDKYNFSDKKLRSLALTNYCKKYKLDKKKVASAFYPQLSVILEEKGIMPQSYGLKKTKPPSPNSDIIGKIQPEPVPDDKKPAGQPQLKTDGTGQGQGMPPPQGETYIITTQHVGAFFAALYLVLKLKWRALEDLTAEEKQALAEMWLPAFQRYMSEKMKLIVLPIIGTIGLLAPKIHRARAIDEKEFAKKENEKKVAELTCKFCNKIFPRAELKTHEESCLQKK